LGEVRRALPDPRVAFERVVYTYAGVRPLSYEEGTRESDVWRAPMAVAEADGRFLSMTGTKLTCFRSRAAGLGAAGMRTLAHRAPDGPAARLEPATSRRGAGRLPRPRRALAEVQDGVGARVRVL